MSKRRYASTLIAIAFMLSFSSNALAMYAPGLGRFCSRDPIGYEGSPFNLYESLDGNPLIAVDPLGEDSFATTDLPYFPWGVPGVPHLPTGPVNDPLAWPRWLCPNACRFGSRGPSPEDLFGKCFIQRNQQLKACGQNNSNCERQCSKLWFQSKCMDECKRTKTCCEISLDALINECMGGKSSPCGFSPPTVKFGDYFKSKCTRPIGAWIPPVPNGPYIPMF
jgi:hypothetical protein